jgi:hypothetical protein
LQGWLAIVQIDQRAEESGFDVEVEERERETNGA